MAGAKIAAAPDATAQPPRLTAASTALGTAEKPITASAVPSIQAQSAPIHPAFAAQPASAPLAAISAPPAAAPLSAAPTLTAATPAALAASITAMHHAGQGSAVLRLDPPGLGNLSVHVALGQGGQVNVLFVPALAQTAQLLNLGMDGLRHAMAATGLTLGQADVSGGGAQNPGQNSANNPRAAFTAPEPAAAPAATPATTPASGVSAYA